MSEASHPCCEHVRRLHGLVVSDDMDAAIEAGLMDFVPCACGGRDDDAIASLLQAQARLRIAWDARERYRQRNARLARRAAEREARRAAAASPATAASPRPALPSAAADILARAKAKAAERMKR